MFPVKAKLFSPLADTLGAVINVIANSKIPSAVSMIRLIACFCVCIVIILSMDQ
jgi:hypothetical protein